jgi:DGQHR domain-containing protein
MNPPSSFPEGSVFVRALEVTQPLGSFYVGCVPAKDLVRIAAADARRKVDREIETYAGIQRQLSPQRQQQIRAYISTFDATFPNTFIIAVKGDDTRFHEGGLLEIRACEKVGSIIDGQHRLSGFTELNWDGFDLITSIFIDLPIEDQAMVFATINLKQTKVSASLVYDLFEETKFRSPEKTCHNISKSLNQESGSPFYHQIKPLGKREPEYDGKLTQATFVRRLLTHVCKNPEAIRDLIKRGDKPDLNDPRNTGCIFWRFFCEEKDFAILKVMTNYFKAVESVFPVDWNSDDSPLSRTIGYGALMRLLEPLARKGLAEATPTLDFAFFSEQFTKAANLAPFTFQKYPASGGGETDIYNDLRAAIFTS